MYGEVQATPYSKRVQGTLVYVGWIKCPLGLAMKSVRRKSVCRKTRKLIVQEAVLSLAKSASGFGSAELFPSTDHQMLSIGFTKLDLV